MAFLPAPQQSRPQCVALRIREADNRVFPKLTDLDLKHQEQDLISNLPGKLNTAVLDRHTSDWVRSKTNDELGGFTRCNGNIIAPAPLPVKPWEPKQYVTRESWQQDQGVFDAQSRRKNAEAAKMQQGKNYADNFTTQRERHECRAMVSLPRERDLIMRESAAAGTGGNSGLLFSGTPQPQSYPQVQWNTQSASSSSAVPVYYHPPAPISGFKGLGRVSIDMIQGKAKVDNVPAAGRTSVPPWLQQSANEMHRSPHRVNPSLLSDGVYDVLGVPPSSFGYYHNNSDPSLAAFYRHNGDGAAVGESPPRSLNEKGISYSKERHHHKKIFHLPDSTGGHPSPAGARMLRRDETTNGEAYHAARLEALAAGRSQTSMLP